MIAGKKVVVVMPAYNAGRTLRMTYEELPKDTVSTVILVDDGSTDMTLDVARQLGLEIFVHDRNYGYGANQKTCYTEALRAGADIVVMVHPDYQYDPTLVPQIIAQVVGSGFRIGEIAVPTRYFKEASQASFVASTVYGLSILSVCFVYWLHRRGVRRSRRFSSLRARYHRLP